jgi:hypothetical protein
VHWSIPDPALEGEGRVDVGENAVELPLEEDAGEDHADERACPPLDPLELVDEKPPEDDPDVIHTTWLTTTAIAAAVRSIRRRGRASFSDDI